MESNIQHVQTKQDWTASEEAIVSRFMATETMHDPGNYTGDRRINCTRAEALRRLQRRKVGGEYREPTGMVLQSVTLPVTVGWHPSPAHLAVMHQNQFGRTPAGGSHPKL
jgi:hypothetical protein